MHLNNGCVVIDENDVGKSELQVLQDLIYESTKERIPLEHIVYGVPRELDARPDLHFDPNTFVPIKIDPKWDDRYSRRNTGYMYRRRLFKDYFQGLSFTVNISHFPFYIAEILPQINEHLGYPLTEDDIVNYKFQQPHVQAFDLIANPGSLLFSGRTQIQMEPLDPLFFNLVPDPFLPGFTQYMNPP